MASTASRFMDYGWSRAAFLESAITRQSHRSCLPTCLV